MPEKKYGLSEDWPEENINQSALKPSNKESYNDLCKRKTSESHPFMANDLRNSSSIPNLS